jgi:hypothetical protein
MSKGRHGREGQDHAQEAHRKGNHKGFSEDQTRHGPSTESQGLQDGVFADALPGGHGHGVGDNGHNNQDNHEGNHLNGRNDGAAHGDEALIEGLFRFRQGLRQGIPEDPVHGQGHIRRQVRSLDGDHVVPHLIGETGIGTFEALVEVIPVEVEVGLIRRGVPPPVDAPEDKLPGPWIDKAFEGHRISDPPTVTGRQLPAGHKPPAVGEKGLLLLRGQEEFGVDGEIGPGFDAEVREEIPLVDVNPAEPVAVGDPLNPLDLTDLLPVRQGQG